MDQQTFDRLTRLFGIAGSRRTAWRALVAGALLGATTRSVVATPRCPNDKPACGSDGCCPGRCFDFVSDSGGSSGSSDACKVCCTEKNNLVICGDTCCKAVDERGNPLSDPCERCGLPSPPSGFCSTGIAGSYRRRR